MTQEQQAKQLQNVINQLVQAANLAKNIGNVPLFTQAKARITKLSEQKNSLISKA